MELTALQRNYNILRSILTSQYWLFITLAGAFFFFFGLNRGGANVFIELGLGFVILNMLAGNCRPKTLSALHLVTLAVCAYLLILSFIAAPQDTHLRWVKHLVRMLGIVFALHCLIQKQPARRTIYLFALVVPLTVCWQFIAKYGFQLPNGTFTNIHYLASFAAVSLPIVFYFFRITPGWQRYLFLGIVLMDTDLLLQTGSRPTILGLLIGVALVLLLLSNRRVKWIGLSSALAMVAVLYLTQYAGVAGRFQELFANLLLEERFELWYRAWSELTDNTFTQWLFGHGIDKFEVLYAGPKVSQPKVMVFPHFFGLELIYLNGIIGATLVMSGLTYVGVSTVISARRLQNPAHALLVKCLIVAAVSWFFHSSLNFPFYSKYAQYPLGFILGALLIVLAQKYPAAALPPTGASGHSHNRTVDTKPERKH